MVVDSSILVAIIFREDGFEEYVFKLAEAEERLISAASYLETSVVLLNRKEQHLFAELDRLIADLEIVIVPVSVTHAKIAREAYAHYGRGRSKAGLNLGDVFSYALAKALNQPLLFKGNDFGQTDLVCA